MPVFEAYQGLDFTGQLLHGGHFMLCAFAVLVACIPLFTEKGSSEHKIGGLIYLPISLAALLLASVIAWRESSLVLFCFNSFCAYLLLSGWRAVHERENPNLIDVLIPASLFLLSSFVALHAAFIDQGRQSLYLFVFALNGLVLSWRDWKHLRRRFYWSKRRLFFAGTVFDTQPSAAWIGRHVAGMVGSLLANLSVVVLTLVPLSLHWLWPVALILAGAFIASKERAKKRRLRESMPASLRAKFTMPTLERDEDEERGDFRRAA